MVKSEFNFSNSFWKINKMFKEPTSCAFSGSCHPGYRVMRNFTRINKFKMSCTVEAALWDPFGTETN